MKQHKQKELNEIKALEAKTPVSTQVKQARVKAVELLEGRR